MFDCTTNFQYSKITRDEYSLQDVFSINFGYMGTLENLRKSANYSKYAVANALKLSHSTYKYMETDGKQFKASVLKRIAKIYGITVTVLVEMLAEDEKCTK